MHDRPMCALNAVLMCLQMEVVKEIHQSMFAEYTLRRRMLVERAKVTLESLLRAKQLQEQGTLEQARAVAREGAAMMKNEPSVALEALFQACQGKAT